MVLITPLAGGTNPVSARLVITQLAQKDCFNLSPKEGKKCNY